MVTRFGMHEQLGQMTYQESRQSFLGEAMPGSTTRNYSEETAREIDCAVRELTSIAREKALAILTANRAQLDQGARLLLEKETLSAGEIPVPSPYEAAAGAITHPPTHVAAEQDAAQGNA